MKRIFHSWDVTVCGVVCCLGYLGDKLQRHVVMPSWFSDVCSVLFVGGLLAAFALARSEYGHEKSKEGERDGSK